MHPCSYRNFAACQLCIIATCKLAIAIMLRLKQCSEWCVLFLCQIYVDYRLIAKHNLAGYNHIMLLKDCRFVFKNIANRICKVKWYNYSNGTVKYAFNTVSKWKHFKRTIRKRNGILSAVYVYRQITKSDKYGILLQLFFWAKPLYLKHCGNTAA